MSTLRRPSALLPIAMSLIALAILAVAVLIDGTARQEDEGTAAHLWQILMAGQLPIIAFFAATSLPRAPKQAAIVLALQLVAILAAAAPVYLLGF